VCSSDLYDSSPEYVNAWIDWNKDGTWSESERVLNKAADGYSSISYSGNMVVQDNFTIPAGTVGPFWMRVNLGWSFDPNDPCSSSWSWGDVKDLEVFDGTIAVTKLTASKHAPIDSVPAEVWTEMFEGGDQCNIADPPTTEHPIADDLTSGSFELDVELTGCPTATVDPMTTVEWKAEIDVDGTAVVSQNTFMGGSGTITITNPTEINKGTLTLTFKIKDAMGSLIRTQVITLDHYTTLGPPKAALGIDPKLAWLDLATDWGDGGTDAGTTVRNVLNGLYAEGWTYQDVIPSWMDLVDGTTSACNCLSFANVWSAINRVLGVPGVSTTKVQRIGLFFLTNSGSVSPDGNTGNAVPSAGGTSDRWAFGYHQLGTHDGDFFDCTFNDIYTVREEFIDRYSTGRGIFPPAAMASGRALELEAVGSGNFVRILPGITTPLGGWPMVEYALPMPSYAPDNFDHQILAITGIVPDDADDAGLLGTVGTSPGGTISGPVGIHPIDPIRRCIRIVSGSTFQNLDHDGDGYAEQFEANIQIDVDCAGEYNISPVLEFSDGTTVTFRDTYFTVFPPSIYDTYAVGQHTVQVLFSGHDIRLAGSDGTYRVRFYVTRLSNGQPYNIKIGRAHV